MAVIVPVNNFPLWLKVAVEMFGLIKFIGGINSYRGRVKETNGPRDNRRRSATRGQDRLSGEKLIRRVIRRIGGHAYAHKGTKARSRVSEKRAGIRGR